MITVEPARPVDVPAIEELLAELNTFYGETALDPVEQRVHDVTEALFGEPPLARALLAWSGRTLVGIATTTFLWPAVGVTKSLYLKELFVREGHRGCGAGELLMRRVCALAVELGCSRVEWTTDRVNTGAQRFYQRLGVPPNPAKVSYRLSDPARLAD